MKPFWNVALLACDRLYHDISYRCQMKAYGWFFSEHMIEACVVVVSLLALCVSECKSDFVMSGMCFVFVLWQMRWCADVF